MIGRTTPRRLAAAGLFVAAASAALASAGPDALVPFRDVAGAATEVSVAFVVDFGGTIGPVVKCVPVPSGDNGYQALAAFTTLENEAPPAFASSGLLCSINGDPNSGCGQAVPGGYIYWSYWLGSSGKWQYANSGATATMQNGDVEGWRFENPGKSNPNDPPPGAAPAYAAICPGVAATTNTAATSGPPPAGAPGPASSGRQVAPASAGGLPVPSSQGAPGTKTSSPAKGASSASSHPAPAPGPGAAGTPTSKPSGSASTSGPSDSGAQAQALRASAAAARQENGGSPAPLLIGGGILAVLIAASVIRWRKRDQPG